MAFAPSGLSIFNDERINLKQEWLDTYELEPYILWKVITLGYKFKEVFVTKIYPPKKLGGYTKMIPIYQLVEYTKAVILFAVRYQEMRKNEALR